MRHSNELRDIPEIDGEWREVDFVSKIGRNLDTMVKRFLKDAIESHSRSILLLGPRQTGKSTLLKQLTPNLEINLADERVFLDYSSDPDRLRAKLESTFQGGSVFIDEVQRLPSLMNTVQVFIDQDKDKYRFLLSGSSARKLRRGHANLLPGRVISYFIGGLHLLEFGTDLPMKDLLAYGCLPGIMTEPLPRIKRSLLSSYAATYLKEEIQAEALTKNIEAFSRFLFVAAAANGSFLDYQKLASVAGITQKTTSRFFDVLEDTLIVRRLYAYSESEIRRLVRHPKFYFFDNGVLNGLLNNFTPSLDRIGMLFETLVFNQVADLLSSLGVVARFSTFRTEKGAEIDFLLETESQAYAIEVKASRNVGLSDLRTLKAFYSEHPQFQPIVIFMGEDALRKNGVSIYPLEKALRKIASDVSPDGPFSSAC